MDVDRPTKVVADEVLVLDSSTFIKEVGLTKQGASALKHYLFHRGTQLVVPEVVAEECERKLATKAKGMKQNVGCFFREVLLRAEDFRPKAA